MFMCLCAYLREANKEVLQAHLANSSPKKRVGVKNRISAAATCPECCAQYSCFNPYQQEIAKSLMLHPSDVVRYYVMVSIW